MSFITTYTKKYFDPLNVDESLLDIKDIAHALSLICRGNGPVSYTHLDVYKRQILKDLLKFLKMRIKFY